MASNNNQGGEGGRQQRSGHLQGLSWLEALFIGLAIAAILIGSVLHAYTNVEQKKLNALTQNSQAVGQWLQAAYLLSQSPGQTNITMCDMEKTRSGKDCITELISRNDILLSLKNPYFQNSENAPIFAVFEGQGSPPAAGRSCRHLAEQFSIITSAGLYQGKPSFWRGTILIYFQEEIRQISGPIRSLFVGYCDGGGRYQRLPIDIPF